MRAGARVSTSAVSLGRYIEFFTECAKEGTPTVYLCFTSALSSSYNSACQAADAVRAEERCGDAVAGNARAGKRAVIDLPMTARGAALLEQGGRAAEALREGERLLRAAGVGVRDVGACAAPSARAGRPQRVPWTRRHTGRRRRAGRH